MAEIRGELRIGIGVSSGSVIAGTVADAGKLDYTLIGDAVNVASRVEQMTTQTGDPLLITEDTRARLETKWPLTSRGPHHLRGKSQPVTLYALELHGLSSS